MIPFDEFKKMELRIASVKRVEDHPNAERLYILAIDIGAEERQIVAGIRNYYGKEELVGKEIVVIVNLQPATIRGVESNGMLLAAKDKGTLALLVPERTVEVGSAVS